MNRTKYHELDNPEGYAKLKRFEILARALMSAYLSTDWEFRWMRDRCNVRSLGVTSVGRRGVIKLVGGFLSFSRTLASRPEKEQRATILHEIAHALHMDRLPRRARLFGDGAGPSHGAEWLAIARLIHVPEKYLARYVEH